MPTGSTRTLKDPFGQDIVNEPRQIEHAIDSLNSAVFKHVIGRFESLQSRPIPRLQDPPHGVVVLSPEPGFGKSHLIGRLFRKLDDDATLIYVRPYQDPASAWISLAERVVSELNYPDDAEKVTVGPGDVTQLDTLARRVMVSLVVNLLDSGAPNVPNPEQARKFFTRFPNAVFETPEWREWLQHHFEKLLPSLDHLLAATGVHLTPSRSAWLRVLYAYAFSEQDHAVRQTCLEWLRFEPIGDEDAKRIGLRVAELPDQGLPYEQRNERCFQRIRELFQLGAFYRPFLLCFDQTELYGHSSALARSFGVMLSRLRRETKNHLMVVTANRQIWQEQLVVHFEQADRDALADPVTLAGVDVKQAEELLRQRMKHWEVEPAEQKSFLEGWLPELFTFKAQQSPRLILREASRRWSNPPPVTPKSLFEAYRQRFLADPKQLDFDPGVFELVSSHVLGPAVDADVKPFKSQKGYLTMEWSAREKDVLLGFQVGSHWRTWEAIVREVKHYEATRKKAGRKTIAAFFRTEQQRLPERSKQDVKKTPCVQLVELTRAETAAVYAAHEFYADIRQGNHELPVDSVLRFLREELRQYAERIVFNVKGSSSSIVPPTIGVPAAIEASLKTLRFATLDMLVQRLGLTRESHDHVLEECRKVANVKVIISPNSTLLRWIQ
jgi:hypothetical protein